MYCKSSQNEAKNLEFRFKIFSTLICLFQTKRCRWSVLTGFTGIVVNLRFHENLSVPYPGFVKKGFDKLTMQHAIVVRNHNH